MEKAFLANGGVFQAVKMSEVFTISTPKKRFDANKITFGGIYPYVARGDKNNGVRGYITEDTQFLNDGNTISFGQDTATMFYQAKPYFTGDKIKVFTEKTGKLNRQNAQYIITAMKRAFSLFGWGSSSFNEKVLNDTIMSLPYQKDEIAFDFMENFVSELQASRLRELQTYLKVTGLADYQLSPEEQQVVAQFDDLLSKLGGGVKPSKNNRLGEFRHVLIEDVLEWQRGIAEINPLHIEKLTVEGNEKYPFYGQATVNNGIISYECLTPTVLNNPQAKPTLLIHSNNQNIVYLETPFYLKDGHGATSVLQADFLNKEIALYLSTAISLVIKNKFTYNFKATKIALKNTEICVPFLNGKPDYALMAQLGKAIQKLVIADVVKYADREMAAYQQAVG